MQIDYLKAGATDCPLIRIYGRNASTIKEFHHILIALCGGTVTAVDIHRLAGFQMNGCLLSLVAGAADQGVRQISAKHEFVWTLTPARWCTVAGFVEPFTIADPPIQIHQWLAGKEARKGLERSEIAVVLSNSDDGSW